MPKRPPQYDLAIKVDVLVYASFAPLGGVWMGALFARQHIPKFTRIVRYLGRHLTPEEAGEEDNQEYMLTATVPSDRRRRVVIDGHPRHGGIGGYANYASGKRANACYSDDADEAPAGEESYVWIMALEDIPSHTELRIDYDRGRRKKEFREQIARMHGVPLRVLDDKTYKTVRWLPPANLEDDDSSDDDDEPLHERYLRQHPPPLVRLDAPPSPRAGEDAAHPIVLE